MLPHQEPFQVLEQVVVTGRLLHDMLVFSFTTTRIQQMAFDHPAYSPDLAPSDNHMTQRLKRFLAGKRLSQAGFDFRRRVSSTLVYKN
ncbi:hypothetical protein AVEN_128359-1 [Araneus ventricosus]|uniref:Histone-lysine N-methyltransferase SETMAR n=1 Tax=Araneus ventricosus TaxID=182803 RepID=A0A4Y2DDV3_ARAVE|nr:hypothetical protein AVEN_128359-1 [Araneus ventricosus]